MNAIGHNLLKYLLIVPLLLSILLGIVLHGTFTYAMQARIAEAREMGYFEAKISDMTLQQLTEQDI